jgi:ABC-type methionine transport system permease subunit
MADIFNLSRLEAGVNRNIKLKINTLGVAGIKFFANESDVSPVELTKTNVSTLIGGSDASSLHNHDTQYSTKTILASTSAGEGAALIGIQDVAAQFTATTVEGALAEALDAAQAAQADASAVINDVGHLVTLSGMAVDSDSLGTFTGSTIADSSTVKAALQSLETAVETKAASSDLAAVTTGKGASLIGIEDAAAQFTATTVEAALAEALDAAQAAQADASAVINDVGHLVTLSGVAVDSDSLGTFTGSTIADASTVKAALQALETSVETKAADSAVIKKDGSVAFTGNQAMGGNKLTGLAAPTANGDALRFDQLGASNGIATLDGAGKVPVTQLPNSVMEFKEAWNPNTNTPSLLSAYASGTVTGRPVGYPKTLTALFKGTIGNSITLVFNGTDTVSAVTSAWNTANPTNTVGGDMSAFTVIDAQTVTLSGGLDYIATASPGDVYRVSADSIVNIDLEDGSGPQKVFAGDFIIYSSVLSKFQRSPMADGVVSVNGLVGAVDLNTDSIPELFMGATNLYFTDARAQAAAVADSITDGVTNVAPSQNAVFDALALKATSTVLAATTSGNGASLIGIYDAAAQFTATTVEAALAEALDAAQAAQADASAVINDVGHLVTLSGVAVDSDSLGTFTGSTIADSSTVKAALQALETSVETKATSSVLAATTSGNGASLIGIYDSAAHFTATTVEAALAEAAGRLDSLEAGASSSSSTDVSYTNNTGSTILAGSIVILSQTVAGEIVLAKADAIATCEGVAGVAVADILNTATGKIRVAGEVTVLCDAALDLGKRCYVSAANAGQATKVAPSASNSVIYLAGIASATGKILLQPRLEAVNE